MAHFQARNRVQIPGTNISTTKIQYQIFLELVSRWDKTDGKGEILVNAREISNKLNTNVGTISNAWITLERAGLIQRVGRANDRSVSTRGVYMRIFPPENMPVLE